MTTSELLRPHEVCRMLGVSRSWLYQAAADRRIPHIRLGSDDGPVRFVPAEIEKWLDGETRHSVLECGHADVAGRSDCHQTPRPSATPPLAHGDVAMPFELQV